MSSVQRNMRAALSKEQTLLEKHLPFLATVASVSPYIGLFGTVWGPIQFQIDLYKDLQKQQWQGMVNVFLIKFALLTRQLAYFFAHWT